MAGDWFGRRICLYSIRAARQNEPFRGAGAVAGSAYSDGSRSVGHPRSIVPRLSLKQNSLALVQQHGARVVVDD